MQVVDSDASCLNDDSPLVFLDNDLAANLHKFFFLEHVLDVQIRREFCDEKKSYKA